MTSPFWPDFLANLLATVVAVALGIPIGLWLNRRAEERLQVSARKELGHALDVLELAVSANKSRLQRLNQLIAEGSALYDTGLDESAWDAVQPVLTSDIGDAELRQRLAYHFSRVAAVRRLNDLLVRYAVGVESALQNAPAIRSQLQATLAPAVKGLETETDELMQQLELAKSQLLTGASSNPRNPHMTPLGQDQYVEHARHYSNLRFAMLGVFLAASAGLLALFFTEELKSAHRLFRTALQALGIVLAVAFCAFEIAASRRYKAAAEAVSEAARRVLFGGPSISLFGPITIMSLGVYVLTLMIWLFTLLWT